MNGRTVAQVTWIICVIVLSIVVLRTFDSRPNPHMWEGGDGPETQCRYEYLADGGGKGAKWIEEWTICDP